MPEDAEQVRRFRARISLDFLFTDSGSNEEVTERVRNLAHYAIDGITGSAPDVPFIGPGRVEVAEQKDKEVIAQEDLF